MPEGTKKQDKAWRSLYNIVCAPQLCGRCVPVSYASMVLRASPVAAQADEIAGQAALKRRRMTDAVGLVGPVGRAATALMIAGAVDGGGCCCC